MASRPGERIWFFVLILPATEVARIRFGSEGQGFALMPPERFLAAPDAVQTLKDRLRLALT